jgi:AcrR family transcriptional regulator
VTGEIGPGLRERKKQRTRATLIDAAIELCGRQGFERTTVDQIAAIADVSPRTFSRYFATKDAVCLAVVDDAIEVAAVELARQPAELNHLEAVYRSYMAMYRNAETAGFGELTAARLICIVRIIMSSPTLRQAATDFRPHAVNHELAKRMGVGVGDREVRLVAAAWSAVTKTALADLGMATDWQSIGIDDLVSRIEETFAQFTDLVGSLVTPV